MIVTLPDGQQLDIESAELELCCRLWQLEPPSKLLGPESAVTAQTQAAVQTALQGFADGQNTVYVRSGSALSCAFQLVQHATRTLHEACFMQAPVAAPVHDHRAVRGAGVRADRLPGTTKQMQCRMRSGHCADTRCMHVS